MNVRGFGGWMHKSGEYLDLQNHQSCRWISSVFEGVNKNCDCAPKTLTRASQNPRPLTQSRWRRRSFRDELPLPIVITIFHNVDGGRIGVDFTALSRWIRLVVHVGNTCFFAPLSYVFVCFRSCIGTYIADEYRATYIATSRTGWVSILRWKSSEGKAGNCVKIYCNHKRCML